MREGLRWVVGMVVMGAAAAAPGEGFKLEIGKETTRVEGPLLKDGTIDYTEALRAIAARGVTEENNAAAVLEKAMAAFRPHPEDARDPNWLRGEDSFSKAVRSPWKDSELPQAAKWLDENDEALTLLVAVSKRARLGPRRNSEDSLHGELKLAGLFQTCQGLVARAMRQAGGGDEKGAIADVEALRRIARLVAPLPEFHGNNISNLIERRALEAAVRCARQVDRQDARKWLDCVQALEELPRNFEWVDKGERFSSLNRVMRYLRGEKQQVIEEVTGFNLSEMFTGKEVDLPELRGDLDQADWNVMLREINRQVDTALEIAREPEAGTRREKWKVALDSAVKEKPPGTFVDVLGGAMLNPEEGDAEARQKRLVEEVLKYLKRGQGESVKAYSERMGRYFAGSLSVYQAMVDLQDKERCQCRLHRVILALEVYRKEKGVYPEKLAELAPLWLKEIPGDVFSGELPVYRPSGEEYHLYSVGPDGRDDSGQVQSDDVFIRRRTK